MSDGRVTIDVKANDKEVDNLKRKLGTLGDAYEGAFKDKSGRWRAANGRFLSMSEQSDMLKGKFKGVGDSSDKAFQKIDSGSRRADFSIIKMATSLGLVKLASAGFDVLKSSLDGAISRFDTMQKFPKVMGALGFSAEDSTKAINKLGDGIDGLPTKLDDVVGTAQRMTTVTGNLDKSTDATIALNNAMLASGATTADASRGMDQYIQMLSTGKVDMQSWRTLQETMPIGLQKTAEAMGYVGESAQNDLYAALQSGEVTFNEFQDQLIELGTGTGDLAELAKVNSEGIATSFSNLKNSVVKGLANLITKFDEIVKKTTGKTIAQNLDSLKGVINKTFGAIEKAMDGIIPLIEGVQKVFEGFKGSGKELNGLSDVIQSFYDRTVSTLGNIFKVIYDKLQQSLPLILDVFGKLGETFGNMVDLVVPILEHFVGMFGEVVETIINVIFDTLIPAILPIFDAFNDTFNQIMEIVMPLIGTIVEGIMIHVENIILIFEKLFQGDNSIVNSFLKAFNSIKEVVMPIFEEIVAFIGEGVTQMVAFWEEHGEQISNIVKLAFEFISAIIVATMEFLAPFIEIAWNGIKQSIAIVWEAIKIIVSLALGLIEGIMTVVMGIIEGDWSRVWEGIKIIVSTIWEAIKSIIDTTINIIKGIVDNVMNGIKDIFDRIMQSIRDKVDEKINAVKDIFTSISEINLFDIGKNIIQGLVNGIGSMISAVNEKVSSIVTGIKDKIAGAFVIKSPSRWMRDFIGGNMMKGLSIGFDKYSAIPERSAVKSMDDIKDTITTADIALYSNGSGVSGGSIANYTNTVNNSGLGGSFVVEVPVNLDGRETARVIAPFSQKEIERLEGRERRRKGVL